MLTNKIHISVNKIVMNRSGSHESMDPKIGKEG